MQNARYFINEWSHKLVCDVCTLFTFFFFFFFPYFLSLSCTFQITHNCLISYYSCFFFSFSGVLNRLIKILPTRYVLLYTAPIQSFDLFVAVKMKREKSNHKNHKWIERERLGKGVVFGCWLVQKCYVW